MAPGPCAPQPVASKGKVDLEAFIGDGWRKGDDYLTLNVWAPAGATRRPVMVWIHGGGLVLGSKDAPAHDGSAFARSGVVCVAINYRLGAEGFLPIRGAPTNLGLRDMLAALTWVRDNIAAFGGDPDNVTVFGESGGGMMVSTLVSSPLAKGLFGRAIVQSGHGSSVYKPEVAARATYKMARYLRIAPDVAGFRSVAPEKLLAAQTKLAGLGAVDLRDEQGLDPGFGLGRFNPVVGDDVLPRHPRTALAAGEGAGVSLLIGTTSEEADLWFVPTGLDKRLPGLAARWMLGKAIPQPTQALKAYGMGRRGTRPGQALARALTDLAFRWPARQFAAAHQGDTHMFEFDWRSPAFGGLGAVHGMDVPFVFDTLETVTGPKGPAGLDPPRDLARRIHGLWVGFATDGRLPWPQFDAQTRQVFQLTSGATLHEPPMPAARYLPTVA